MYHSMNSKMTRAFHRKVGASHSAVSSFSVVLASIQSACLVLTGLPGQSKNTKNSEIIERTQFLIDYLVY